MSSPEGCSFSSNNAANQPLQAAFLGASISTAAAVAAIHTLSLQRFTGGERPSAASHVLIGTKNDTYNRNEGIETQTHERGRLTGSCRGHEIEKFQQNPNAVHGCVQGG